MKIGSHVSNSGKSMLLGSIQEALSYNANCLMIYLGAPQNTYRKPTSEMRIKEMKELAHTSNILLEDIIIHAPYIVNLAQNNDEKWNFACDFLSNEIIRANEIGAKYVVIHPGAHVGMGVDYGLKRIAEGFNKIINNTKDLNITLLIETMSGKGTECGKTFEEIKIIIDLITVKQRVGVCLDTCHIYDSGYDIVHNYNDIINKFNHLIGLDLLKVIHLNDSKNLCGSHKDRHANIGYGNIGYDTIMKFINDSRFSKIPKILETPYVKSTNSDYSYAPYRHEIAMIKSGIFNSNLYEDIINEIN